MEISNERLRELAEFADDMEQEDWNDVSKALHELITLRQRNIELGKERDEWRDLCKKYSEWPNGIPLFKFNIQYAALLEKYKKA